MILFSTARGVQLSLESVILVSVLLGVGMGIGRREQGLIFTGANRLLPWNHVIKGSVEFGMITIHHTYIFSIVLGILGKAQFLMAVVGFLMTAKF